MQEKQRIFWKLKEPEAKKKSENNDKIKLYLKLHFSDNLFGRLKDFLENTEGPDKYMYQDLEHQLGRLSHQNYLQLKALTSFSDNKLSGFNIRFSHQWH